MSSYLRSISNKFTSFVTTRRQVTSIGQPLTKHIKSSLVFVEVLDAHTIASCRTNSKENVLNSIVFSFNENALQNFHDTNTMNSKYLNKECNCVDQEIINLYKQKQNNIETINFEPIRLSSLKHNTHTRTSLIKLKNDTHNSSHMEMDSGKRIFDNALLNNEKSRILYTKTSPNIKSLNKKPSEDHKPSENQLQDVFNILRTELPLFFAERMNYDIYTNDIVFVNNLKGKSTVGINQYAKQLSLLKVIGHLRFAYIKLKVLKITMHPEDSSIKVRWRIIGVTGTKIFLSFWKFDVTNIEDMKNQQVWYDGFSTFYVNNDGKIFKHVVDKMMPDQNIEAVKTPIETKLALFSALQKLDSYHSIKFCSKIDPQLFQIK